MSVAEALMGQNDDLADQTVVDRTVQVPVAVPPEARNSDEDVTVRAEPAVMLRALGIIKPDFEIDERLLSALTLPPPRTTPLPPAGPLMMPALSRRPSRPPPDRRDDMRGVVFAIWTVAALLFGVLAVLVRSTS
jgi:hypothetical protein